MFNSISEIQKLYQRTADFQKTICENFYNKVNEIPQLKALRDFVEENQFGHGERCFYEMWRLIVEEMPQTFTFMEIGVFKGQTMVLIDLLCQMSFKGAKRIGVSPLDSSDNHPESDYEADIRFLNKKFGAASGYVIIKGRSEEPDIISTAQSWAPLDILYIDGNHSYRGVCNDIIKYTPFIKSGGFLIMDDACTGWPMPEGYFQGIASVTDAVDALLPPVAENEDFEFCFNVAHNRVYRKR